MLDKFAFLLYEYPKSSVAVFSVIFFLFVYFYIHPKYSKDSIGKLQLNDLYCSAIMTLIVSFVYYGSGVNFTVFNYDVNYLTFSIPCFILTEAPFAVLYMLHQKISFKAYSSKPEGVRLLLEKGSRYRMAIRIIAISLGVIAGILSSSQISSSLNKNRTAKELIKACDEINQACPMMVSENMRIDSAKANAEELIFFYTAIGIDDQYFTSHKSEMITSLLPLDTSRLYFE